MFERTSRKSPNYRRNQHEYSKTTKFLAALAIPSVVAVGATAFAQAEQGNHAERYNNELHGSVVKVLEQLGDQDSTAGVAIIDGKDVTGHSLAQEKADAMTTVYRYFTDNQSVRVERGQAPADALWAEFSSGSYNPDSLLPRHDATLDQSEQVILSVLHGTNGEIAPETSRDLLNDVVSLNSAMEAGSHEDVSNLETKLEHDVKSLANQTLAGQTDISIPNSQNF